MPWGVNSGWNGENSGWGRASAASYDAATTAWVNAVVTAGGTVSTTQEGYVDTLVKSIKGDVNLGPNINSVLDRLWLFANADGSEQQAIVSVANPASTNLTLNGFTTPTADLGYTGDGASLYILSNFTPSSAGGNYALNSASLGVAIQTTGSPAASECEIGANDGTGIANIIMQSTGFFNVTLNQASSSAFTNTPTIRKGMWVGSRTASNSYAGYANGSSTAVCSDTTVTNALPTFPFRIFASNGGANSFSTAQISLVFIGGGLSATAAASLMGYLNTYLTSLGHAVY